MILWYILGGVLILLILGRMILSGRTCNLKPDLHDRVVIVTGASAGIGEYSALHLAKLGATVILGCRSEEKTKPIIEKIKKVSKNDKVHYMHLDCSSMNTVTTFAQEFKTRFQRLDILIHNAGTTTDDRRVTKDGFENVFQVNYLVIFYLTHLLIDVVKASSPARIVIVSSVGHRRGDLPWDDLQNEKNYQGLRAYSRSKLYEVMFAKELNERLESQGVKTVTLHPGLVRTEIWGKYSDSACMKILWCLITPLFWYISRNSEQGAQTTLQCSLVDHEKLKGGDYYDNCKPAWINKLVTKDNNLRLWNVTNEILKGAGYQYDTIPVASTL